MDSLLRAAGFADLKIDVKPESHERVASWAPGRGIEKSVASAIVEARKSREGEAVSC